MKILLAIFLAAFPILAQQTIDFNSPTNIKLFADYLFCEKDYLRAADEYKRLNGPFTSDTIIFKTGLCYFYIGDYSNSKKLFDKINPHSNFFDDAAFQKYRISFLESPSGFYSVYQYDQIPQDTEKFQKNIYKLAMISSLFNNEIKLSGEEFFQPFNRDEKKKLEQFFNWKNDPPRKSPLLAGILSTIIPGSGKIYAEEYGDGIMAFITTGLLTFISYDNFRAKHYTRGWIFASLSGLFYAGNIYGSIASAQIYNAKISFEFKDGINLFLEKNNYFSPEYDFCK